MKEITGTAEECEIKERIRAMLCCCWKTENAKTAHVANEQLNTKYSSTYTLVHPLTFFLHSLFGRGPGLLI